METSSSGSCVVVVACVLVVDGAVVDVDVDVDVDVGVGAVVVVDAAGGSVDDVVDDVVSGGPIVVVAPAVEVVPPSSGTVEVEDAATMTWVTLADRSGDGVSDTLLRTLPTAAVAMRIDTRVAPTQAATTAMRRGIFSSCLSCGTVG